MKPTEKQTQTRKRNFNIFRLRGAVAILQSIKTMQTDKATIIHLNNSIAYIKDILEHKLEALK